ncbi:periplasmic heavy metal sensor [Caulobacter sp.]|uniref:periplasmic heavy metal sensor n=1 Tax=Caulobacter sp. TaxID=78 RepID=UPI003BA8B635
MTLSRSLLIGLIVSAALNVFLIGGVAGVVWVRRSAPPPPSPHYAEPPERPLPGEASPEQVLPQLRQPPAPRAKLENPLVQGEQMGRRPLWTAGQNLSPESRQALRRALREANQRNQPITRQARGERQAALQALKAKSYDPAEVSKRLAAARALDIQARGNVEAALSSYAATLSPEERAALADGLARVYAQRPRANGQPR